MNDSHGPVIGITAGKKPLRQHHLYAEAVAGAGGIPRFLYPGTAGDPAAGLDGLLLPGGRDIDPSRFGEARSFTIDPEDEDRTEFEMRILEAVLKYNIPVFGICYGMQLINVYFGGSLYQDIGSQVAGALDHTSGEHDISVDSNPYIPQGSWRVNSSHHQSVRIPGTGLVTAASSPDGLTEALYASGERFIFGVQWHPERMKGPLSDLIFDRFIAACTVK